MLRHISFIIAFHAMPLYFSLRHIIFIIGYASFRHCHTAIIAMLFQLIFTPLFSIITPLSSIFTPILFRLLRDAAISLFSSLSYAISFIILSAIFSYYCIFRHFRWHFSSRHFSRRCFFRLVFFAFIISSLLDTFSLPLLRFCRFFMLVTDYFIVFATFFTAAIIIILLTPPLILRCHYYDYFHYLVLLVLRCLAFIFFFSLRFFDYAIIFLHADIAFFFFVAFFHWCCFHFRRLLLFGAAFSRFSLRFSSAISFFD